MGRIANGATLSVRNLPSPVVQPGGEREPPPHYLEWLNTRMLRAQTGIARYFADLSRSVEEYAGESMELPTGETTLTVIPDYEPAPECITSVLVTGPANTPFTLELGDRLMTLVTNASGFCLLAPVFIKLKPISKRLLTAGSVSSTTVNDVGNTGAIVAATAGNITIPAGSLTTGFSVSLSTVGTASMTVTISNVAGGPFTYNIPAGQSLLSITFPQPLQGTGATPTLSWTATAAAVGNANLFGTFAIVTPSAPGSWMLQMSGYALKANEA